MRRTVKDVMTADVVIAEESMPYKELAWLMESKDVSALPVVDPDGRLVGIVSESDLLLKEEFVGVSDRRRRFGPRRRDHAKAAGTVAADMMSSPVVTTTPDASIAEAARVLHRHQVKRLPVVDAAGRLAGIVSRKDLLGVFLRSDEEIRREVVDDVMFGTLWLTPQEADIRVTVRDGVVCLRGWVGRKSLMDILIELVYGVEGVVAVDKQIIYREDDTHLRPQMELAWGILPEALRRP